MAEALQTVGDTLLGMIEALGYLGVFLGAFIETIFPPLPSELIMPFGGFLAGRGKLEFAGVVAAGTAGAVAGAVPIYFIGRWAEDHVLRALIRRYGRWLQVSEHSFDRVLGAFDRHGQLYVFGGRLIPTVRTLISIPAGMERMHLGKFLFFTTLGTAIWMGVLAYAGMMLGENWEQLLEVVETYKALFIAGVAVLAAVGLVYLALRSLRNRASRRSELDFDR
jgi:membrane protein DedA with SNARE-associated domain